MDIITLNLVRYKYSADTTLGKLYLNDNILCYTLEDAVRPYGIKIKGQTAIFENPNGYNIGIKHSNRFKRDMLCLYTEEDKVTIKQGGVSFSYVYFHGGNTHINTEGCPLVASNVDEDNFRIYNTYEAPLFKLVKKYMEDGYIVKVKITNLPYVDKN
jgi:hypothetical protein